MTDIRTVEAFPTPNQKMGFLYDWLVTMKCNYDCSYCGPDGPDGQIGGHDNRMAHPSKEICLKMLEHGFEYVDAYMENKKPTMRSVTLNIYGGEALYHPDIEEMMEQTSVLYNKYKDRFSLVRNLTTNATATQKKWENISEHLEQVTFSWHSQGPDKLKKNFLLNLDITHKAKKRYDLIILMYPGRWAECITMLRYLQNKGYNARPRILDGKEGVYTEEQLRDMSEMWASDEELVQDIKDSRIHTKGRACCGGRSMCTDRDYKNPKKFIPRDNFIGWQCSANQFFLMANCQSKNFYTNKDCHVRHDGTRGPIATLDTMAEYVVGLKHTLSSNSNHFLKCVQKTCLCGSCAPKSMDKEVLMDIMKIYNAQT